MSDSTSVQILTETHDQIDDDGHVFVNDTKNHMSDNTPAEMSFQTLNYDYCQTHTYNTVSQKE